MKNLINKKNQKKNEIVEKEVENNEIEKSENNNLENSSESDGNEIENEKKNYYIIGKKKISEKLFFKKLFNFKRKNFGISLKESLIPKIYPFMKNFFENEKKDNKLMFTKEENDKMKNDVIVSRSNRFKPCSFLSTFTKFLNIFGSTKIKKIEGKNIEIIPDEFFYDQNCLEAYVDALQYIGKSPKTISNYLLSAMRLYDNLISINFKRSFRKIELYQDRMRKISSKLKVKHGRLEKDDELELINEFKMITPSENAVLIFKIMIWFSNYFSLTENEKIKIENLMNFQKKLYCFLICVGGGYRPEVFIHLEKDDFVINQEEKTLSFVQHKEKTSRQGQHGVLPYFCAFLINYWKEKLNIFIDLRNDGLETVSFWINKNGYPWGLNLFNENFKSCIEEFLPKMKLTSYSYRRFVVTNFLKKNYDEKNTGIQYFIFLDKVSRFLNTSKLMMHRNYNISKNTKESNQIQILLNESIQTPLKQLEFFFNSLETDNNFNNIKKDEINRDLYKLSDEENEKLKNLNVDFYVSENSLPEDLNLLKDVIKCRNIEIENLKKEIINNNNNMNNNNIINNNINNNFNNKFPEIKEEIINKIKEELKKENELEYNNKIEHLKKKFEIEYEKKVEIEKIRLEIDFEKKLEEYKNKSDFKFYCIICKYGTNVKRDFNKHLITQKHKNALEVEKKLNEKNEKK
jgi:hypothetical protein